MRYGLVPALLTTAWLAATPAAHAGLLVNESFEAGTAPTTFGWNEDAAVPGWQFQPGGAGFGNVRIENGSVSGKHGNNYMTAQFGIVQTSAPSRVAVNPGAEVSVSLLFRHLGNVWTNTLVYLDFYDNNTSGNYEPLSSSVALHLPNQSWPGFTTMPSFGGPWSLDATAPEGASYVGVRFVTPQPAGDLWPSPVQFDNVHLTVTPAPEPASMVLLGLLAALPCNRPRRAARTRPSSTAADGSASPRAEVSFP